MHYLIGRIKQERGNLLSIVSTSFISIGASFIMMLAFANLLDQATLGIYQYIIATVSIIASISLTGIYSGIIRATSHKHFSFLQTALRYALYSSLIPLSIAFLAAGYYTYKGNHIFAVGILFSTAALLTLQIQLRYNAIYVGIEEFKKSNYLLKAYALAPLFILFPALFFTSNPAVLAMLYFGSSILGVAFTLFILKTRSHIDILLKNHKVTTEEKKNSNKNLWFSVHQSIILLIGSASSHLDKIIIFQVLGPVDTAIYFVATSIPDRLRSTIKQFEPYLFSKFAKHTPEAARSTLTFKFLLGTIIVTPFFTGYILTAPIFFHWFLPQYVEAINLTLIYGFTLFASTLSISQAVLRAQADNKSFYILMTGYGIIKAAALFPAAYFYGIQGAIIVSTVIFLLYTLMTFIFARFSNA